MMLQVLINILTYNVVINYLICLLASLKFEASSNFNNGDTGN